MLDEKSLIKEIDKLKREQNACILAHNYQLGEIQDIADYTGDSLELAQIAAKTEADVLVLCGVYFMAETASILSPQKKVLLPSLEAGCLMADMITADKLKALKEKHPKALVVTYVNSSAEVKAESDVCCTSSNALKVVESLKGAEIIFTPDENLGQYIESKTGRKMHLYPGFCPTHARITKEDIINKKAQYPQAKVIVHPECRPEVINLADEALSTGGMIKYVKESSAKSFIIGTEVGIIHRLKKENPGKIFIPISEQAICPQMKLIRLEDVLNALKEGKYEVKVPEDIRKKAEKAVCRMLEVV